jgi:hypothetical protein
MLNQPRIGFKSGLGFEGMTAISYDNFKCPVDRRLTGCVPLDLPVLE